MCVAIHDLPSGLQGRLVAAVAAFPAPGGLREMAFTTGS